MSELSRNELCVGIDLGTSNSLIATCKKDGDKLYTPVKSVDRKTDAKGGRRSDRLLPSYVYYIQGSDGKFADPIVGDYAKELYSALPFLVAKSIKSQMGLQNVTGLQEGIPDKTPEEVSASSGVRNTVLCTQTIRRRALVPAVRGVLGQSGGL